MSISFSAPAAQMRLAARIVNRSIERGDWDEDACDLLAPAASAFSNAAGDKDDTADVKATLSRHLADEMSVILGSDAAADGPLADFLAALEAAISTSWTDGSRQPPAGYVGQS